MSIEALEILESEAGINADFENEYKTAEETESKAEADKVAAAAGAAMAVAFVETIVRMKWEFVQIEPGSKDQLQEKVAAVLAKHGGGLPEWLQPYREEIELGVCLSAVGFGVFVQVQAHKAANDEPEATEEGGKDAV